MSLAVSTSDAAAYNNADPIMPLSPGSQSKARPDLAAIKRKLSSSGQRGDVPPQLKSPASPTSPLLEYSSDEYLSPQPSQGAQFEQGLAVITESDDSEDGQQQDDRVDRQSGVQGLYTESAIKSGYLMKKGERRKNWKKRYFVLRPSRFGYYKDDREYKLLRDIPLLDIRTCAKVQVKKHDFSFGIVTTKRTFYVRADTEQDANEWVQRIDEVAKAARIAKAEEQIRTGKVSGSSSEALVSTATNTGKHRNSLTEQISASLAQPISIGAGTPVGSSAFHHTSASKQPAMSLTSTLSSSVFPAASTSASSSSYLVEQREPSFDWSDASKTSDDQQSPRNATKRRTSKSRQAEDSMPEPIVSPSAHLSALGPEHLGPTLKHSDSQTLSDPIAMPAGGLASSSDDEDDDDPSSEEDDLADTNPPGDAFSLSQLSTTIAQSDPGKIIVQGYLAKQGKRKSWRKRWFTLTSQRLSYSRSHMNQKVNRSIPLSRILDVVELESASKRQARAANANQVGQSKAAASLQDRSQAHSGGNTEYFAAATAAGNKLMENCFKIITAKRIYLLCATDEEAEIKWISAIRVLLTANRQKEKKVGNEKSPTSAPARKLSTTLMPASPITSSTAAPNTSSIQERVLHTVGA